MRNRLIDLNIPFISKWLDRRGLQKTIREMYEGLAFVEHSATKYGPTHSFTPAQHYYPPYYWVDENGVEHSYSQSPSPSPSPSPEITEDDGLE